MPVNDDMPFSPDPDGRASPTRLIEGIVFHVLMKLNVAQPGTVQKWTAPVTGKLGPVVDVKLDFKYARTINNESDLRDGETLSRERVGLRAVGEWETLPNVPVVVLGSPAFCLRGPIPIGTTGLVVFLDALLDQWKSRGGPLDPGLNERHSRNNAVFLPSLFHGGNTPDIDGSVNVLGPQDGSAGFEIANGQGGDKSLRAYTDGPQASLDASTTVTLGSVDPLVLKFPIARQGDDVSPRALMSAWANTVETFIEAIAPGTFIPGVNDFATVAALNGFGQVASGSAKSESE